MWGDKILYLFVSWIFFCVYSSHLFLLLRILSYHFFILFFLSYSLYLGGGAGLLLFFYSVYAVPTFQNPSILYNLRALAHLGRSLTVFMDWFANYSLGLLFAWFVPWLTNCLVGSIRCFSICVMSAVKISYTRHHNGSACHSRHYDKYGLQEKGIKDWWKLIGKAGMNGINELKK